METSAKLGWSGMCFSGFSLPMRDGNYDSANKIGYVFGCFSLPMRDGNGNGDTSYCFCIMF